MAGMNQFLAQPALVDRILGLERRRQMLVSGLGRDGGRGLVDMGLDHQALQEKSQQREDAHPFAGGRAAGNGVSHARHKRLVSKPSRDD